jgi:hypothetical protein
MPHIEIIHSKKSSNAGARRAGSCWIEACAPPWFHALSRYLRPISNAANAAQSFKAAGNADWKALCADLLCGALQHMLQVSDQRHVV